MANRKQASASYSTIKLAQLPSSVESSEHESLCGDVLRVEKIVANETINPEEKNAMFLNIFET